MYPKSLLNIFIILFSFLNFSYAKERELKRLDEKKETITLNSFLNLTKQLNKLSSENKRLLVFFHEENCLYCDLFITKNLKDEKIKNKLENYFGIVNINIFGDKKLTDINGKTYIEKEFALKNRIQFIPSFIFYDEQGKQILRLNGYQNIKNFNLALDYIKNKRERLISFKNYISQNKEKAILISEPDLFKDSKNFIRNKNSKKMAIFFESANCEECEILHKNLLKNSATRDLLKQIDNFQVDINSTSSVVTPKKVITKIKDWTETLNITHIPTIIFFDENAKEIIRVESSFKNSHFQTIVDYVVSDIYKEKKEFQRYLYHRKE